MLLRRDHDHDRPTTRGGSLSLQPGRARVDHAAGQVNGRRKAGRRRGRAKSVGVISDRPPPGRSGSSCGGRRQQASPTPTWTPAPDFSIGKHRDADRLTAVWPSAVCSSRPAAPFRPLALWPSRPLAFSQTSWSVSTHLDHDQWSGPTHNFLRYRRRCLALYTQDGRNTA